MEQGGLADINPKNRFWLKAKRGIEVTDQNLQKLSLKLVLAHGLAGANPGEVLAQGLADVQSCDVQGCDVQSCDVQG